MRAEFHVVFDAELYRMVGKDHVRKVRPKRMTQRPPDLSGGEVALRFSVDIPDTAFLRLMPEVKIDVAEGFWTSQPVHVEIAHHLTTHMPGATRAREPSACGDGMAS